MQLGERRRRWAPRFRKSFRLFLTADAAVALAVVDIAAAAADVAAAAAAIGAGSDSRRGRATCCLQIAAWISGAARAGFNSVGATELIGFPARTYCLTALSRMRRQRAAAPQGLAFRNDAKIGTARDNDDACL